MTVEEGRNACYMALVALEKQMPKKPRHEEYGDYCPVCDWDIHRKKQQYCDFCGQALEWGDG